MRHLILGGVKSGKSKFAENTAELLDAQYADVSGITLIATAQALDAEMALRIERHKLDRSDRWQVIEEPICLADSIKSSESSDDIVVIDCLTLWLTNLLMLEDENRLLSELEEFECAVQNYQGKLILVSNETNMGIMPLGELSRRYCDLAGRLHKNLAETCEKVDLVVAGLPLKLKPTKSCRCDQDAE